MHRPPLPAGKIYPKYEPYIAHTEVGTPFSTNHFLGTDAGECYGRSATPKRWLCPDLSPYTPVPNFYLTGQVSVCTMRPAADWLTRQPAAYQLTFH